MKINPNGIKILFGFFALYGIYELRKFYIRVKTRILFEQLWEYILMIQESNPEEFRRLINKIAPPPTID